MVTVLVWLGIRGLSDEFTRLCVCVWLCVCVCEPEPQNLHLSTPVWRWQCLICWDENDLQVMCDRVCMCVCLQVAVFVCVEHVEGGGVRSYIKRLQLNIISYTKS